MNYTISHPAAIIAVLLAVELTLMAMARSKRFAFLFRFLPSVFWIYFLPMLLSTAGLIDRSSKIYSRLGVYVLPAALFLLLLAVDIRAILRLGRTAVGIFLAGSFGIVLGMVITFAVFRPWIGSEYWSGFAALSGSWTGGSANLVAVKEAFQTPQNVFAPIVIVDTIVPYIWMAILLLLVRFQDRFNRWNKCDLTVLEQLQKRNQQDSMNQSPADTKFYLSRIPLFESRLLLICILLVTACVVVLLSHFLAGLIPSFGGFSKLTWVIVISSSLGLLGSLLRIRPMDHPSKSWGNILLYLVLTSIGAQADLSKFGSTYLLVIAGFLVVAIHAGCLYAAARIFRVPLFLVATASQANIGGVASAPVVADCYQSGLASVGLLMAILGNIIGTYIGILTGQVLHWIATLPI
jgi:uncharacterized membrane protein